MGVKDKKMTKNFYIKMFLLSALFYFVVLMAGYLATSQAERDSTLYIYMSLGLFGLISSFFFPLAYKFAERFSPSPIDSIHWKRGLAVPVFVFAIPLVVIELILRKLEVSQKYHY